MKNLFVIITAFVLLFSPAFIKVSQARDRTKEESFVAKTIINGRFETEASKLAIKKSKNEKIRVLARQIIDAHSDMSAELQDTLNKTGIGEMISFQELDDEHQSKLEDLAQSSARNFDEDYTDAQILECEEAITLFEDYISEGKNAELVYFAKKQLPLLNAHEDAIKAIEKSL